MQLQSLKKVLLALVAVVGCGTLQGLPPSSAWADEADGGGGMSLREAQLLQSINAERKKAGLSALWPQEALMRAAQYHASNMAQQGIGGHVLDGEDPYERVLRFGYDPNPKTLGENWAGNYATSSKAVAGWMTSKDPIHRHNILMAKAVHIGVGIAKSADGSLYYCYVCAAPR